MTTSAEHRHAVALRDTIDTVEESYEFMLAYAAQGRKREAEDEGVSKIRDYLNRFAAALEAMENAAPSALAGPAAGPFRDRFLADLAVMRSVIAVLLSQPSISSDMVDNTNGLIAVRSFLTDLFFIDQAMLPPR
ncbi:MAG: hypothetical protein JSU82_03005 [Rhodospirillales bacterium]|nr:MAG: hypothetical protein JSU82_03005 [Rhodospirillales bacterium]